jgi:DeoR/GlpR family transcriptional regulator of sugar metabolism
VVVADHTKWGQVGLSTIAALDDADVLVSDQGLETAAATVLEEVVGDLVLVTAGREEP